MSHADRDATRKALSKPAAFVVLRKGLALKNDLTADRLRELLHYDSAAGVFTRRVSVSPATKAGDVAGRVDRKGYSIIGIDGKYYKAHRLAWLCVTGAWPADQVDHRDRNRANNRFANLREVTNAENQQNSIWRCDNKSGYRGVSWHKGRGAWCARITIDQKVISLGYFRDPKQAATAYQSAKIRLHKFAPEGLPC